MDSFVIVWPLEIIGSLYADLVQGVATREGFMMKELRRWENLIVFKFTSSLSSSGCISLEVTGERKQPFEAETSAVTALIEALRTYGQPDDHR